MPKAKASGGASRARERIELDSITVDVIENAIRNIRNEMDATIFRSAMSPIAREEKDAFNIVTDEDGNMLVGQFGWDFSTVFRHFSKDDLYPGDVIIQNDPYLCEGAISQVNDTILLRPIFYEEELVGFAAHWCHLMDVGGSVAGSMPCAARSIFEEGTRIPPVKLYERGGLNQAVLDIMARNSRLPEMLVSDVMALTASTQLAANRVIELCDRFGMETYQAACRALFERARKAMRELILQEIQVEPLSFEDYLDDDGLGNGPLKIKMSYWREGDRCIVDWAGTDPSPPGPIPFYQNIAMFKTIMGIYLIMVHDADILFNAGFYDLFEIRFPPSSMLQPDYPHPCGNRAATIARMFDVISGAMGQRTPELSTGANCGASPHLLYSGYDDQGRYFLLVEMVYGGIPGRPVGDGMDGHSWFPETETIPAEYLEAYYPLRVEYHRSRMDSGGAGLHRGGNGIEKLYTFLAKGEISIQDDRTQTQPWGINGGRSGTCSYKTLIKADGTEVDLPSKIDFVEVEPGDRLFFVNAGAGGWGNPLERPYERVRKDVLGRLVSVEKARSDYGVVFDPETFLVDVAASDLLREEIRVAWGELPVFDFGPRPEPLSHETLESFREPLLP